MMSNMFSMFYLTIIILIAFSSLRELQIPFWLYKTAEIGVVVMLLYINVVMFCNMVASIKAYYENKEAVTQFVFTSAYEYLDKVNNTQIIAFRPQQHHITNVPKLLVQTRGYIDLQN